MKQLFYIKSTPGEEPIDPVLSLGIGEKHICFAVTGKTADKLYSLAYYSTEDTDSEMLSSLFADHKELNRSFYSVQVSYDHAKNTLIPNRHYDPAVSETMLDTVCGKIGPRTVITEAINEWQLYNVYAVPADILDWVNRRFPGAVSRHHFTLGMKTMPPGSPDRLLVNIHTGEFSYVAIRDNKLLVAQTQVYASPEDICYYLLKTCHQFSLSQEEVQLTVSGLVEKESQLYREMYQFFVNLEFREPAWDTTATESNEYPAHYFTALNDLARCAS